MCAPPPFPRRYRRCSDGSGFVAELEMDAEPEAAAKEPGTESADEPGNTSGRTKGALGDSAVWSISASDDASSGDSAGSEIEPHMVAREIEIKSLWLRFRFQKTESLCVRGLGALLLDGLDVRRYVKCAEMRARFEPPPLPPPPPLSGTSCRASGSRASAASRGTSST